MSEIVFRGGRLPADPTKPRLRLRLAAVSAAPASADWLSQVPSYPMYLNDRIGDCTCAAAGHMEQAWTAAASSEVTVPDSAVLKLYELASGYDPATGANDDGAVMQDVLGLWRKSGLGGHKILGFAQIDHLDHAQVKAAIAAFGTVYVGVNFPQSAMDQFDAGREWTVVASSPIEGGHAGNVGAYDSGTYTCVTWGEQQKLSSQWWAAYVEEAWVVVTQEWIEANGNTPAGEAMADLGEQFTQLTGEPNPFPVSPSPSPGPGPVPVPDPDPAPTPAPVDVVLAAALVRFLSRHPFCPRYLRRAAQAWLDA